MKKIVFIAVLFCSLPSCVNIYKRFENDEGKFYDVYEAINIPDSLFSTKVFYSTYIKDYDTISGDVSVSLDFGIPYISYDDDIQEYDNDPSQSRFKYAFQIPTAVLPNIKLNSFSFTDKKGNIIPSILYYKTDNTNSRYLGKTVDSLWKILLATNFADVTVDKEYDSLSEIYHKPIINIIDSFPAIFTNDVKKNMEHRTFEIYAECSQSYRATKLIYVNYDIEIGNKRYVKQVKYESKWRMDWRPKFW